MPLAGIGSRFIALLVDMLIWAAGLFVLAMFLWILQPALEAFSRLSYQWVVALITFTLFVLNWGYFTLFEAFWNGRTPGKRVARIRVIQQSGRPIGLFESMARNLVRYVDQIPFFYAVGVIAMFATKQHQRLGDLAAGTLVVRDGEQETPHWENRARGRSRLRRMRRGGRRQSRTVLFPCPRRGLRSCRRRISRCWRASLHVGWIWIWRLGKVWRSGLPSPFRQSRGWKRRREPASRPFSKLQLETSGTWPGCVNALLWNLNFLPLSRLSIQVPFVRRRFGIAVRGLKRSGETRKPARSAEFGFDAAAGRITYLVKNEQVSHIKKWILGGPNG